MRGNEKKNAYEEKSERETTFFRLSAIKRKAAPF